MDSDAGNECSHSLGFPIRKSPDHSLLAASRGLSQLTASFFAFLRLGIHTHALSSLTITSTSYTHLNATFLWLLYLCGNPPPMGPGHLLMPVNIQLSKISIASAISKTPRLCELLSFSREWTRSNTNKTTTKSYRRISVSIRGLFLFLVGPGGIEPPTSPLSGVRSSQLSYGPSGNLVTPGGAGRDRTGDLLNANQALSQLSYSP